MSRFTKRGLVLALPLALIGSLATTSQSAELTVNEALAPPSLMDSDKQFETANGCCWIYIWGRWWCVPCG